METLHTYYVAPYGNDAWSGTLPEVNAAGTDGPWASVAQAQAVLRTRIAGGMTTDLTVLLRGGDYYLHQPLTFDERDSGRDGYTIHYRHYPEETPVINGGDTLTGWQALPDGSYAVPFDPAWSFGTLCAHGRRCRLARNPNTGYLRVAEKVIEDPHRQFRYAPGDLPEGAEPGSLRVFIWPGGADGEWNWFSTSIVVQAIDRETRTVTLAHPTSYELGAGSRYYWHNAREFFSEPDEFFVDSATHTLYYQPDGAFDASAIVIPRVNRVIACVGSTEEARVTNLCFEGLTLRNADTHGGLVYLANAEGITVRGCTLHSGGGHGVLLHAWAQHNTITGNHIYDIGDTGIMVEAPQGSRRKLSRQNLITNNHVHDTGQIVGHGAGIQLVYSGENAVTHNRVHDTPRYSVSLKGLLPTLMLGKTLEGVLVTRENVGEFGVTRDNTIAFNDLSRANTDSQDTGVIEAWGAGVGNVIHNNRIHDSDMHFSFGFGIYLDDACNEFTVTHNLLDSMQWEGAGKLLSPLMIKGVKNVVSNNLMACNRAEMVSTFCEMAKEPNRHLVLERNVAYDNGDGVYGFTNWDTPEHWDADRIDISDYNLFYNPRGNYLLENVLDAPDFAAWQQILDGKYEQHTLITDPLLLDAAHGDYRMRHDSPAFTLGFEEIDFQQIGLTADYPFADPADALEALHLLIDGQYHWFARLPRGGTAALQATGRTVHGYVADLRDAAITYQSETPEIVTVSDTGELCAIRPGAGRIIATVTLRGRTLTTPLEVVVSNGAA